MSIVHDFAFYFGTFSLQNITGLDGKIYFHDNIDFDQAIKFVNLVVASPCETEPYNDYV